MRTPSTIRRFSRPFTYCHFFFWYRDLSGILPVKECHSLEFVLVTRGVDRYTRNPQRSTNKETSTRQVFTGPFTSLELKS